jgi:signal transduction histidine kinase/ligand-binding sensor domain-containing protein/DNA-binding response OmpR family regulator
MLRLAVILSILLALPFQSQTQTRDNTIHFDYLTVHDGLSDLTVRSIIQDHAGYMWFGTNNGLNRYDGKEIIKYFNDRNNPSSLKGNIIYCMFEDSRKNLWIGTWGGGLSLYNRDLDNFTSFRHNPDDSSSIRHNDIWNIFEDSADNLWIATQMGLERFNYDSQTFEKHLSDLTLGGASVNLKSHAFSCITEGENGSLWISIWKHGILHYDPAKKEILHHFMHEPGNPNSLNTSEINTLYADKDGSLWIGPYKGHVEKMTLHNGQPEFKKYPMGSPPYGLSDNRINFIIEDQQGMLWIGTEVGVNILNKNTGKIDQYFHNAGSANSLSSNHLWAGYCNSNGIIWIGTLEGGVNIYDPGKRKFSSNYPMITDAMELPRRFVKSIHRDSDGILWVGTDYGLNKLSPNGAISETYTHGSTINSLDIGGVSGIIEGSDDKFWIGTWGGGLHVFNKKTKKIKRYYHPEDGSRGLGDLNIQTMVKDYSGNILIGTVFGYLYLFDPEKDVFQQYLCQDIDSLRGTPVIAICPDKDGSVWIGLSENGGVIHYNFETGKGKRYYMKESEIETSLSSNDIFSLLNDDDLLWIGTKNGLNLLDKNTGKISVYDERNGLVNKSVLSIQKDAKGNIWFSTLLGISKLVTETGIVYNYDNRDGALGNSNVSWKGLDSELYFGGIHGLFSFNPENIHNNAFQPPVVFTSLKIFNHPVYPGQEDSPLQKHINQTEKIVLDYHQTSFSFEFSALNFTLPEKNQFLYKLENFDQDWVHAGNRNVAYYTNVGPGEYTFKVKGSNNDGLWNENERIIHITVLPPWWHTIWFRLLLLVGILAMIAAWVIIRTFRYKHNQKILKQMVDQRTREIEEQKIILKEQAHKLHIADQMKIKFFTNISHEFRTPLTLIINPINKMLKELANKEEYKLPFTVVKRNTLRLISLINQFLDISKIEAGELKLHVSKGNIVEYILGITNAYQFATRQKRIQFKVQVPDEPFICYFDGDKIEKILYNLLSNALKFTPTGKMISVKVALVSEPVLCNQINGNGKSFDEQTNHILIKVKDTGKGIPTDKIGQIFERFYQVEGDELHPAGGTGIGLALTKDLVDIYRGTISVKSKIGEGTEFKILLPTHKSQFADHEIISSEHVHDEVKSELVAIDEDYLEEDYSEENEALDAAADKNTLPVVLVVEDNRDVREYLSGVLSEKYKVKTAPNGEEGLRKAIKHLPKVIISDVMMPLMNGFELCEKLKTEMLTCHIPVILLTAKANSDDKITGYKLGADVYISKPFDVDVVMASVDQLIENREKLKSIFKRESILQPKEIAVVSSDEKLLDRIIKVLEDRLSDSEFGVEELSREVGISRTHLYRKIKELTSLTAIEFIRNMRLKRAAGILKQNKLYVSEVAYMCGFNELSYFRKIFKELFGVSPQKYAAHINGDESDDMDETEIINDSLQNS